MAFCESNANSIPLEREVLLCTGAKTYGGEHIRYIKIICCNSSSETVLQNHGTPMAKFLQQPISPESAFLLIYSLPKSTHVNYQKALILPA
jgi:hypothetical protein